MEAEIANSCLMVKVKCGLPWEDPATQLLLEAMTIGGGVGLEGLVRPLHCLLSLLTQVSGTF